ncbi:hypothetical protein [Ileibacterium valens]|uniref:hypothetical protein n=1 Tax=Ileibacterium valens TaxID=1862668 RepID=UPI0023541516|nr:hypothetical protein [Ileibacterium valens]
MKKEFTQKQVKELIDLFEKLHKQLCSNIQEIDSHTHNSVNICHRLVSNEFVSLMEEDLIGCIQRTQISGENKYWNTFLQFYQTQQHIPIRERLNEMLKTISTQIMAAEDLVKLKDESFLWTLHRLQWQKNKNQACLDLEHNADQLIDLEQKLKDELNLIET